MPSELNFWQCLRRPKFRILNPSPSFWPQSSVRGSPTMACEQSLFCSWIMFCISLRQTPALCSTPSLCWPTQLRYRERYWQTRSLVTSSVPCLSIEIWGQWSFRQIQHHLLCEYPLRSGPNGDSAGLCGRHWGGQNWDIRTPNDVTRKMLTITKFDWCH